MDFYQNYKQNTDGIELCLEQNLMFPALTLIYSSIDIASWMAFGDIKVEERFTTWVKRWMYRKRKLEATPLDLYAARCALLHTLSPDSSLSKKGAARTVVYAWGKANLEHLKLAAEKTGVGNQVCIHVSELFEVFQEGVNNFIEELDVNSELQEGFQERLNKSYENITPEEVVMFLDLNATEET